MSAALLDTCAAIWLANGDPLDATALDAIRRAALDGALLVSPVTAWEVGLLARRSRSRVVFAPDPATWFARLVTLPGLRETPLTARAALASSDLPGDPHGDPADRLIVATARDLGIPLVTRDRRILAYASAGHVAAIAC